MASTKHHATTHAEAASSISKPVGDWQKGSANESADVIAVQTLLTKVADKLNKPTFKPNTVNGTVSKTPHASSTVKAIMAFQKDVLGIASPDGRVDPGGKTLKGLENLANSGGFEKFQGVDPALQGKAASFIARYGAVTISSGKRTTFQQAVEMAKMSDTDLNMYGAASDYVVKIKAIPRANRTVQKVQEILDEAREHGHTISKHLDGKAVDISAAGHFHWHTADAVASQVGLKPKREVSRNCFHVNHR